MKTFLSLLAVAITVNILFAMLTYLFFHGQIEGANTLWDYFHYAIMTITTHGTDYTLKTSAVRLWTSTYVLLAWVYIFWVAINHISNVKFGRLG